MKKIKKHLFFLILSVVMYGCSQTQSNHTTVSEETNSQTQSNHTAVSEETNSQTQTNLPTETFQKNGQTFTKCGSWIYSEKINPMTDEVLKLAQNISENEEQVSYGKTHLGLGLTFTGEISTITLVINNGSFRTNLPQINVRFDNGNIKTYSVYADGDRALYIINDAERFMEDLSKAQRIAIEVEEAYGGEAIFTFNNSGFSWEYPIMAK